MIISHKYKLIFIHIPKNAGTFITQFLKNLDEDIDTQYLGHIPSKRCKELLGPEIWSNYVKFCVIRNTWDNVLSMYFYNIKLYVKITFEEYIHYIKNNVDKLCFQTDFILDENNENIVDYIIKFDNLENDLCYFLNNILKIDIEILKKLIPKNKINQSTVCNYISYYDSINNKKLINTIYDIYIKDIDYFGFKSPLIEK